ncbi:MAG: AAA family ATPase [Aeropyrum sp.]|nr:AAA family ATPase [Aeropyrum sp.]MCE4616400.1 AAA family ATPase [Aeropyrum sp.]
MIILIAGVPGTGKSSVAGVLAGELGCSVVEQSQLLIERGAASPDPSGRLTYIIDWDRALDVASGISSGMGCRIVVSVTPLLWLEAAATEVAFIALLRTDPRVLEVRLSSRGWVRGKVVENVLAEAFGVLAEELYEFEHDVVEVDTTRLSPSRAASKLLGKVEAWKTGISIDWLSVEGVPDFVSKLLSERDFHEYRGV